MDNIRLGEDEFLQTEVFFVRMMRNSGFRIFYKCIYNALRLMYLRYLKIPLQWLSDWRKS